MQPQTGHRCLGYDPSQATVYVAGKKIGETPVQFELDLTKPVSLRIIKEGYVPAAEFLTLSWAQQEHREGRYKKGDYFVQGQKQSGFEIHTTRVLQEDPAVKKRAEEAKREAQRREEEAKRYQEFVAWCNSMIGKDYREVVNRLGLPGQTVDIPNGNKTVSSPLRPRQLAESRTAGRTAGRWFQDALSNFRPA